MKLDIVFAGMGGQGILFSSDILCEAALLDGFDVAKAETHGMAQRGGSVVSHVRIGDNVVSPMIERGTGDVSLGFEILEAARALPWLKEGGTVILNNRLVPTLHAVQGLAASPTKSDLVSAIRRKAGRFHEIDGRGLADEAGSAAVVNMVFLGALMTVPGNPLREESLVEALSRRVRKSYLDTNKRALMVGKNALLQKNPSGVGSP